MIALCFSIGNIIWSKRELYLCVIMFKLLTIGVLLFLMYRLVFPSKQIKAGERQEVIEQEPEPDDFIDYEEIE